MKETPDTLQKQLRFFQMENVRLVNELAARETRIRFLEEENAAVERETRMECGSELERMRLRIERLEGELSEASKREKSLLERLALRDGEVSRLEGEVRSLEPYREVAAAATAASMDLKDVLGVINRRTFGKNSDATRYLNDEIDPDTPYLDRSSLDEIISHVMRISLGCPEKEKSGQTERPERKRGRADRERPVPSPEDTAREARRRNVFSVAFLERIGIDAGNLPKGASLIRRKDRPDGEDTWYVRLFFYDRPKARCKLYKIGRFNVPGGDPECSRHPATILPHNPVMPSFARFYLDSKINLGLPESRILEMLRGMGAQMPQSSLNLWMHGIMSSLREELEPMMLEVLRASSHTNNDGTRILVRSRESDDAPFKYRIEYIQAALSAERKVAVMLYDEGSRDHSLQEEMIFRGSSIRGFTCDRAPQYGTIVSDLPDMKLVRQACWFHARHYFVDAYLTDRRVSDILMLINTLFHIERTFREDEPDTGPEARLRYRLKHSLKVARRIMERLESIRAAGDKYGKMVHRAVNYVLDDKEAFLRFLQDGGLDMHNNAIERCFRHIAVGRRNWLHSGSHPAARNLAFMFGLLESCKLNGLDFGEYVEDILTRKLYGEKLDETALPCSYIPKYVGDKVVA